MRMFPIRIIDFYHVVNDLSESVRSKLLPLLNDITEMAMQRGSTIEKLERALSEAESEIQHPSFDLWATRKERDAAQHKLDGQ